MAAFHTRIGWVGLLTRDGVLSQISCGHAALDEAVAALDSPAVAEAGTLSSASPLVRRVKRYFAGARENFADLPVDLETHTDFQRAVVVACRAVGYGETISYGELARRAGYPGAARAVGSVMSRNRLVPIVPCHRILAEGGRLGGYSGPRGLVLKQALLELEQPPHRGAGKQRTTPKTPRKASTPSVAAKGRQQPSRRAGPKRCSPQLLHVPTRARSSRECS